MSLVFKVGDKVFHVSDGPLIIKEIDEGDETYPYNTENGWYPQKHLSFTPWPEPNHVRPIQEGLHIIKYDEQEYLAIWKDSRWRWALGDAFTWGGLEIMCANHVQSVKFLSELPKN